MLKFRERNLQIRTKTPHSVHETTLLSAQEAEGATGSPRDIWPHPHKAQLPHPPTSPGRALPTPCCGFSPQLCHRLVTSLPAEHAPTSHPSPSWERLGAPQYQTARMHSGRAPALPWQREHPWAQPRLTRMMLWQVVRGSPTRLVPLTDMRRSPMLSSPERSAGPPCMRLATTTVGRMEPQPDSTMAMPRISPFCFRMQTCGGGHGEVVVTRRGMLGHGACVTAPARGSWAQSELRGGPVL